MSVSLDGVTLNRARELCAEFQPLELAPAAWCLTRVDSWYGRLMHTIAPTVAPKSFSFRSEQRGGVLWSLPNFASFAHYTRFRLDAETAAQAVLVRPAELSGSVLCRRLAWLARVISVSGASTLEPLIIELAHRVSSAGFNSAQGCSC